jgi:hypothetical protein
MIPVFGYASASRSQTLLKLPLRKSLLSRGQEQWCIRPWICQQCYHQNQRTTALRRASRLQLAPKSELQVSRHAEASRASFSTSRRKLESRGSSIETNKIRNDLPSQEEGRRSHLSKRISHILDHLQSNIFIAGQRLNDLTGYSGIEALKKDIEQQGRLINSHVRCQGNTDAAQRNSFKPPAPSSRRSAKTTPQQYPNVPIPSAKSTSSFNVNTPGLLTTSNDSRHSTAPTMRTSRPRSQRKKN